MDWAPIETTLQAMVATGTGLSSSSVEWSDENAAAAGYPHAVLKIFGEEFGPPDVREVLNGTTGLLDRTTCAAVRFTLTVTMHAVPPPEGSATNTAKHYAGLLVAHLLKESTRETLNAARISVIRVLETRNLNQAVEGAWIHRSQVEVQLASVMNVADSSVQYIEKVEGQGTFPPGPLTSPGPWGIV